MLIDVKQIRNIPQKLPVRAATTSALSMSVYENGYLGFGATLTAYSDSTIDVIDGVTPVVGDRLLIKNEVNTATNGIYEVTSVGSISSKWVLTRAEDCDTSAKTFTGVSVISTNEGVVNGSEEWFLSTNGVIDIGITDQTWTSISSVPLPPTPANEVEVNFVAQEDISQFDVVTSKGFRADTADYNTRDSIIGFAKTSVLNGFSGKATGFGEITNPAWTWLRGDKIFLNGLGTVANAPPSSTYSVQLGTATTPNTINVNINPSILL